MTFARLLAAAAVASPVLVFLACGGGGQAAEGGPKTANEAPKPESDSAGVAETKDRLSKIGAGAVLWRSRHPESCPANVDVLKAGRALDPFAQANDAWGNSVQITCTTADTKVASAGPDGKHGTADDIVATGEAPPPAAQTGKHRAEHTPDFDYAKDDAGNNEVALPPPEATAAEKLNYTISSTYQAGVKKCMQAELQKNPRVGSIIEIEADLVANGEGKVDKVVIHKVGPDSIKGPLTCVLDNFKGMQITATGKEQKLRFHVP